MPTRSCVLHLILLAGLVGTAHAATSDPVADGGSLRARSIEGDVFDVQTKAAAMP